MTKTQVQGEGAATIRDAARSPRSMMASGLALLLSSTALVAPTIAFCQPAAPASAPAPAPAAAAPSEAVSRIVVRGNERIEQATILSYLPIQPNTRVTARDLNDGRRALDQTGLFSDVTITVQGGDLIVQVAEHPIINRVIFEGNSSLKTDKLRDEVTARPRGIYTRAKIQQDAQRIIELYRRSGRISATITPKIVELPQKRVDLVFEIDEGPKSGVVDINFLGNQRYSDNDLQDVIITERSKFWKLFANNDNYDPDRIEADQDELRKFYRNKGYYDFRVVSAVAELIPDQNKFALTYTIEEGERYRFGKLNVQTTLQKLDGNILRRLLPIREGDLYKDEAIEQATDALTYSAGTVGFAFVDITPQYTANPDTRTVDVTFQVEEGPRVYVERVNVIGNTVTVDPVIRREILLAEGDAFNQQVVELSRNRLRQLEFFKDVTIENLPGSTPDKTVLQVKVEEQPTGELSASAGYSSVDRAVVDLGITQRNFRGRGQSVQARVSTGSIRKSIDFQFTEPRFQGRNLSAGFDIYSYHYDFRREAGYETSTNGVGLRFGFPLSPTAQLAVRYTLKGDDIQSTSIACGTSPQPVLCTQVGLRTASLLGYTWALDRRNDPISPTRGYSIRLDQDITGFGGDVNYVKSTFEASWYYGFTPSLVLKVQGEGGYIDGYGGGQIRINDRFFKGGNTFRGFEVAGIGPRDTQYGDALGGKLFGIGTVELTIPTFLPEQYGIKGALFAEFGTLGLLDARDKIVCGNNICQTNAFIEDDLSLRASAGLSIKWRSPFGPVQLDFSKILVSEKYDRRETFRFTQSTRF